MALLLHSQHLANARIPMSSASATVNQTLATLQDTLASHTDAWAPRARTAQKSYLAAVMGSSLARNCRETEEWSIDGSISSDDVLSEEIRTR